MSKESGEPKLDEKELIPFEKSMEVATSLLAEHGEEIHDIDATGIYSKSNLLTEEDRRAIQYGGSATEYFFRKFPDAILERFVGHGMFRKEQKERLASLINVLQNRFIQGDCARLQNSGYYDAVYDADFVIISYLDKHLLAYSDSENRLVERNDIGWLADIGACVVDAKFYPIVEDLRRMFPDINIIKANEIENFITQELEKK